MKQLEITIKVNEEPNAALVEALVDIVDHVAKTLLVIGHPELEVGDASVVID